VIRWVFFDVGNVLFIDEPLVFLNWEAVCQAAVRAGHALSFKELMARRERLVREQQDGAPYRTVALELLGEEGLGAIQQRMREKIHQDYWACNFVLRGIGDVLAKLSGAYRLAVAANQPEVCRQALEAAGLLKFFKVVGISDERGLSKPSPAFFEMLLKEAGCAPSEGIMVGDRIDNDIAPAKRLGMRTIWFNLSPEAQGYVPRSDLERLYVESLRRAPSRGTGHPCERIEPDVTVTALDQLRGAVEKIATGGV
jgi:HAD superfamily hydrolase (TIGR01509 family)